MPTPFIMPKMDMDQESVIINEWLKKEGDPVEKGEPVILVETDKITSEVESPASGRLARVLYEENAETPVTEVIAYILHDGETEADLPDLAAETKPIEQEVVKQDVSTLKTKQPTKAATPVAQRMAQAEEIDLSQISASGDKITKKDVEDYLDGVDRVESRVKTAATPAARRLAAEANLLLEDIDGSGPRGRVQAEDVNIFKAQSAKAPQMTLSAGETLPLSNIRKRIGTRLQTSYQTAPHINLTVEVDMYEAEQSRKRMNELAAKSGASPISMTAYLVRFVAWALKRHPLINASLQDDAIHLWESVNIGVATAIDEGLIVPVIHNADQRSAQDINETLRNLTEQARSGELTLDQIQDGTFTITNLGMYGIHSFTAIINPPQSAILAVGTILRKPIVIDEEDTIKVHPTMMLTLAADHRVIDGAVGAEFLADLVKALETPELLIY
jgi:pyruvate dehydrogenase E2 component (dihydrolipoamide acetyltransferase)